MVSDFLGLRLTTYTKLAWSPSGGRGRTQTRSHRPVPVLRVLEPQACAATAAPAFCRAPFTAPVPAHAISPPLPLTSLTPSGSRPHASPPAPGEAAPLPTRGFPSHSRSPSRALTPLSHSRGGDSTTTCLLRSVGAPRLRAPLRRRPGPSSRQAARQARDRHAGSVGLEPRFRRFPAFSLSPWNLRETESSLPALGRKESKLGNWSPGRREALPGAAGLVPGPGVSADEH